MGGQPHVPWRILGLGLVFLASVIGCQTTRIQTASQDITPSFPPTTRVLVVVDGRPGTFRSALEAAVANELHRRGVLAEASIPALDLREFEADPARVARNWSARTSQSFLVLRPLDGEARFENKDQRGRYESGQAVLPTQVIEPRERTVRDTSVAHASAGSRAPSYVPDYAQVEELRVFEVDWLDPRTGLSAWRARALTKVREGKDEARWMAELSRVVVGRLKQAKLVP